MQKKKKKTGKEKKGEIKRGRNDVTYVTVKVKILREMIGKWRTVCWNMKRRKLVNEIKRIYGDNEMRINS